MAVDGDAIFNILDNEQDVAFFIDEQSNKVYAEFKGPNQSLCFEPVTSERFKRFLRIRYREETEGDICSNFDPFVEAKCDDVIYEGKNKVSICHRVTGSLRRRIFYFLADDQWQSVAVTKKDWKIVPSSKLPATKFLKVQSDSAQVTPDKAGGDYLKLLRPYINLSDDDFMLLAICIAHCFSRESSHFALVVSGDKGTGKSTLTKLLRSLIDPSKSGASIMPPDGRNLTVLLSNSYMACFDNTAALKAEISDILCSAITGATMVARKLYTDSDQTVLKLHNVIVLNGIDIVPYKSDLAERCLLFEPQRISKAKRRTDSEFWVAFEADKPAILGAIFETLHKAMTILPTIQVSELHRMGEAHKEMIAIANALGISTDEFQRIFQANLDHLQDSYAHGNPFVDFVLDYIARKPSGISLPANRLYTEMQKSIVGSNAFFPKSPSALSRKLREEQDSLLLAGYKFDSEKKSDSNYIKIKPIPKNRQTKAQREAQEQREARMTLLLDDASSDD